MSHLLAVVFSATEFNNINFLAAPVTVNLGRDARTLDIRGTHGDLITIDQHQDIRNIDLLAFFSIKLFYPEGITGLYLVLFATGFDHRIHYNSFSKISGEAHSP